MKRGLTIPLHTDRIKLVGESERLLAADERGRYTASLLTEIVVSGSRSMGVDIRIYAEIQRNNEWEPIPEPAATRYSRGKKVPIDPVDLDCTPYRLFVMLGGVYHSSVIGVAEPIAKPRDLPPDMNAFYKTYFDRNGTGFARSWLLLREIIDYGWDDKYVTYRACVNETYVSLFDEHCSFPETFPPGAFTYHSQQPDTVWVSWRSSCREFINLDYETCLEDFIEELTKLGDPDKVRIVFWFI